MSRAIAILLLTVALAACSKATPENYAKLDAGMTRDQVYAILGTPDDISSHAIGGLTTESATWKGPHNTIEVRFVGDKLLTRDIEGTEAK